MIFMFDPVCYDQPFFFWDYRVAINQDFKGYCHWHQTCEFMLVHEGRGSVVVNQQSFDIKKGMFFLFQPYQLHEVYADVSLEQPYVRSIFYADPLFVENKLKHFPERRSWFEGMWRNLKLIHAYDLTGPRFAAMELILEQYEKSRLNGCGEEEEQLMALFLQMLTWLPVIDLPGSDGLEAASSRRKLRYSEMVMNWIGDHYQGEVSMDSMAEELHLSPNYLSRVFREETGRSITDYLTARRIRQACRLLETTDFSVERIGHEVGYSSFSYFIQLFKREVGQTPLQYRFVRR